jgi:hypothetical protein
VVEEWDGWLRVQLPEGVLGFVPNLSNSNRSIFQNTLIGDEIKAPSLGGLLLKASIGIIGGAISAGWKEATKDV